MKPFVILFAVGGAFVAGLAHSACAAIVITEIIQETQAQLSDDGPDLNMVTSTDFGQNSVMSSATVAVPLTEASASQDVKVSAPGGNELLVELYDFTVSVDRADAPQNPQDVDGTYSSLVICFDVTDEPGSFTLDQVFNAQDLGSGVQFAVDFSVMNTVTNDTVASYSAITPKGGSQEDFVFDGVNFNEEPLAIGSYKLDLEIRVTGNVQNAQQSGGSISAVPVPEPSALGLLVLPALGLLVRCRR